MNTWTISYDGKSCIPSVISENVKQDTPKMVFGYKEKSFSVEFKNQSDYMSSRYGTEAEVTIITANRKKRYKGTAVNNNNN